MGFFFICLLAAQAQLTVNENGRYLTTSDGSPFYWLGDTGWALFQKLTREEVDFYFETRAEQGFSVVYAAVYNVNPFVQPPLSNVYEPCPSSMTIPVYLLSHPATPPAILLHTITGIM